jgi:hypothetical protein
MPDTGPKGYQVIEDAIVWPTEALF